MSNTLREEIRGIAEDLYEAGEEQLNEEAWLDETVTAILSLIGERVEGKKKHCYLRTKEPCKSDCDLYEQGYCQNGIGNAALDAVLKMLEAKP